MTTSGSSNSRRIRERFFLFAIILYVAIAVWFLINHRQWFLASVPHAESHQIHH